MRELIVTMEPFHIVNAPAQRPQLPATMVPVTVSNISELENMVTITDGAPVRRAAVARDFNTDPLAEGERRVAPESFNGAGFVGA
ncbi:hypothetical protein ABZ922_43970 [Streptomyces shenzhenensis]|uniref:hypothetical protein n=1 Tax=Streptomyces shenzhenensis TaxID=943815 RepID=UPI0033D45007